MYPWLNFTHFHSYKYIPLNIDKITGFPESI